MNIQIKNGRLIDPKNNFDAVCDVFIVAGRIAALGTAPGGFAADRVVDASGLIVAPGLIDLAARLREPGYEYMATLESEMDIGFFDPNCHLMPPLRRLRDRAALQTRQICSLAPVSCASASMVASAMVSAHTGMAGRPQRVATSPSCATPFLARKLSCGRSHTEKSKVAAYCIARSNTRVSVSGASAWLNATHPASASSAISVSSCPLSAEVSAPTG